jgi:transcriptional regulator with XRE-family HTH domain
MGLTQEEAAQLLGLKEGLYIGWELDMGVPREVERAGLAALFGFDAVGFPTKPNS